MTSKVRILCELLVAINFDFFPKKVIFSLSAVERQHLPPLHLRLLRVHVASAVRGPPHQLHWPGEVRHCQPALPVGVHCQRRESILVVFWPWIFILFLECGASQIYFLKITFPYIASCFIYDLAACCDFCKVQWFFLKKSITYRHILIKETS